MLPSPPDGTGTAKTRCAGARESHPVPPAEAGGVSVPPRHRPAAFPDRRRRRARPSSSPSRPRFSSSTSSSRRATASRSRKSRDVRRAGDALPALARRRAGRARHARRSAAASCSPPIAKRSSSWPRTPPTRACWPTTTPSSGCCTRSRLARRFTAFVRAAVAAGIARDEAERMKYALLRQVVGGHPRGASTSAASCS